MTKSDLSTYIGNIGAYQWRVFVAMFIINMFTADSIQIIFIAGDMPHWCHVPELYDLPYDVQKNVAIPAESVNRDGYIKYSSCEMFSLNYSVYNRSQFYSWNRSLIITNDTSVVECSQWMYDQSQFISTIVSKFNLVCGRNFLVPLASSVYMAGVLVGSVTSGILSDRFGRKRTMLIYYGIKFVGILMSMFGPNYATFAVGRFIVATSVGYAIAGYVLVMELVGERYRPALGTAFHIGFSIGFMLQPTIAYCLRDEFWYQVAANTPNVLLPFLIIVVVPESPRWLAVQRRYDEVTKLLHKMCKINARELPRDFHPTWLIEKGNVSENKGCMILLATPTMRLWTLIMDFAWFTVSVIYYALAFNTGTLHGDHYMNTFLSGATEVPAYSVSVLLMNWNLMGRRRTGCLGLVGAAAASFICIPVILSDLQTATTVLSILGKALVCISFAVVYVHSSEMFPTEVRNVGLGTASMCARISSLAASYVGGPLAVVWKPLPSVVFGVLCTVSGLLYVILPETFGQVLPDTIEQAERLGKHNKQTGESGTTSPEESEKTEQTENMPTSDAFITSTPFVNTWI